MLPCTQTALLRALGGAAQVSFPLLSDGGSSASFVAASYSSGGATEGCWRLDPCTAAYRRAAGAAGCVFEAARQKAGKGDNNKDDDDGELERSAECLRDALWAYAQHLGCGGGGGGGTRAVQAELTQGTQEHGVVWRWWRQKPPPTAAHETTKHGGWSSSSWWWAPASSGIFEHFMAAWQTAVLSVALGDWRAAAEAFHRAAGVGAPRAVRRACADTTPFVYGSHRLASGLALACTVFDNPAVVEPKDDVAPWPASAPLLVLSSSQALRHYRHRGGGRADLEAATEDVARGYLEADQLQRQGGGDDDNGDHDANNVSPLVVLTSALDRATVYDIVVNERRERGVASALARCEAVLGGGDDPEQLLLCVRARRMMMITTTTDLSLSSPLAETLRRHAAVLRCALRESGGEQK